MLGKIFNIQKNIRDIAATTEDPTYVHTIISEIVLKAFTLVIILTISVTVVFGVLGVFLGKPGWWIMFAIGSAASSFFLLVHWMIKKMIRQAVDTIYKTVKTHVG